MTITDFHKQFLIDGASQKTKYLNIITQLLNEDSEVNYNVNSDYVVFAGRITESKGVEELLLSWQKFLNTDGLSLKIIVECNLDFKLKNIYNSNNIEFIGHLNNYDVKELISKSRAVITATKMYEGQPRLLCEASSLGVPSIFPKFGGMNEFFPPNYELAFEQYNYDDLNEKLLLLKNKIMLEKYSQENFQYINSYLSEEKLEKIFLNIIS